MLIYYCYGGHLGFPSIKSGSLPNERQLFRYGKIKDMINKNPFFLNYTSLYWIALHE
jgi:hypothetical protein